jgi:hypothetical protein
MRGSGSVCVCEREGINNSGHSEKTRTQKQGRYMQQFLREGIFFVVFFFDFIFDFIGNYLVVCCAVEAVAEAAEGVRAGAVAALRRLAAGVVGAVYA